MTQLIFASSNKHKAAEIASLLPAGYQIKTMLEAGFTDEITEPYQSLEENSMHKAETINRALNINCFAEDTGLETVALAGAPGVYSARFAGEPPNDAKNMEKLLMMLQDHPNRNAHFKTVITLVLEGISYQFTGICKGQIAMYPSGTAGFGYDPVFIPDGSDRTFAEMTMDEKNKFSHRKKALAKMISFLAGDNETGKR